MKISLSVLLCCVAQLVSASGCNKGLPKGVTKANLTKTHTAHTPSGRTFYYHLPANYDSKASAVVYFSFHGGGKNASNQEQLSSLSEPSFNPYGIAVYPEAVDGHWLSHPGVSQASPNDIDFTLDVITWLDTNLCIDKTRIYATGKSNGGGLVNLLACNATSAAKFAGFAAVSGAHYENKLARNCAPGKPIPFISFHGLSDDTIPYGGGCGGADDDGNNSNNCADVEQFKKTYPIDEWLKDWLKRNNLANNPVNKTLYDQDLVTRSRWSRTGFVNITTHYKEKDLGHVWPSTFANPDCPRKIERKCPMGHYTFNATTVILQFFENWHL